MKKAWEKIDLEGGGLQAVNQRLSRTMKRHSLAYALWLLFPLGLHRHYLAAHKSGLVFPALTLLALLGGTLLHSLWALSPLLAVALFALYDLIWIDRQIVIQNKRIRMQVYLGTGAAAPAGYRGRYPEDTGLDAYIREKEQERAGVQPVKTAPSAGQGRKAPSFAEQEAMLRELSKRRGNKAKED